MRQPTSFPRAALVIVVVVIVVVTFSPFLLTAGEPTSFAPLAELQQAYGRLSGGAPPQLVPSAGVYVGLAHLKQELLLRT